MNSYLILEKPELNISSGLAVLSAKLRTTTGTRELWYSFDQNYVDYVDPFSSEPFLLPALIIAMHQNRRLVVRGRVDGLFFHCVRSSLQDILAIQYPGFQKIEVDAENVSKLEFSGQRGVGTGFSCGVDSLISLKHNFYDQSIESARLTHLLQINHSQGANAAGKRVTVWERKRERYMEAADEVGLPLVFVGSNLYSHSPVKYQQVHTLLNCSAVLAFPKLFKAYFYASGYHFDNVAVVETHDVSRADPILLPLISTASTRFFSAAANLRRPDKTREVLDLTITRKYLDVCTKSPSSRVNCSLCYKCERTMMTLDALGRLNEFHQLFDMARWKRRRASYIAEVREPTTNMSIKELQELGEKTGYFKKMEIAKKRREQRELNS